MNLERIYSSHVDADDLAWIIYKEQNTEKWVKSIHPFLVYGFEAEGKTTSKLSDIEINVNVVLVMQNIDEHTKSLLYFPIEDCFKTNWEAGDECGCRNKEKENG